MIRGFVVAKGTTRKDDRKVEFLAERSVTDKDIDEQTLQIGTSDKVTQMNVDTEREIQQTTNRLTKVDKHRQPQTDIH